MLKGGQDAAAIAQDEHTQTRSDDTLLDERGV
jgi:hypothetical protein